MPDNREQMLQTQPYNCLFVKGVMGSPENVLIYLDNDSKRPHFEQTALELITKGKPVFIPFTVCKPNKKGSIAEWTYALDFANAWVFDNYRRQVFLKQTSEWGKIVDEHIDEIQAYMIIEDNRGGIGETLRNLFTFSRGSRARTNQIRLRFYIQEGELDEKRPTCLCVQ